MPRIFLATIALVLALPALAHDDGPGAWINHQNLRDPVSGEHCCNLNDGQEEDASNIEARPHGYLIHSTQEFIEFDRVIWKSPGGWWRCRYMDGSNRTRCLIGPPPSG